jgi:hypothetical protein
VTPVRAAQFLLYAVRRPTTRSREDSCMFEGFERVRVETEGASINAARRGEDRRFCCCSAAAPRRSRFGTTSPLGSPKWTDVSPKKRGNFSLSL